MESTLNHLFQHAVLTHARPDMFRSRQDGRYVNVSSHDFDRAVRELSQGLLLLDVQPGDRVALLSENRLQWALADLGILGARGVVVPLYPTLRSEQIRLQLQDSKPVLVFCSTAEQVAKLETIREQLPFVRQIISFEPTSSDEIMTLDALRERGRQHLEREDDDYDERINSVDPDDLATILYTSGTTGEPKGVMLTHRNITFNVDAGLKALAVSSADCCLSFLPLSHILERTGGHYAMMYAGVSIAYAESLEHLSDNMLEVQPSVMVSVPRLFEKIDAKLLARASERSPFARRMFLWVKRHAMEYARRRIAGEPVPLSLKLKMQLADLLVFRKLQAHTGGRLRFFVSGGAPLPREIAEFFYAAGIPILEGYGLTETSPVISLNTFEAFRPGSVGRPVPGVEVAIASDGEILTRSPAVMKGYYNRPEETAEVMREGWFHTGDIGNFDNDGFLYITDRKKDLIVTSGGKNVAPQPIESELKTDPLIDQVALIGDRRKFIVALIAPHLDNLSAWAHHKGIAFKTPAELSTLPEVQRRLQRTIDRANASRASFEQIKRFAILDRELSLESGDLTPTLKVKRGVIQRKYADLIEDLYVADE